MIGVALFWLETKPGDPIYGLVDFRENPWFGQHPKKFRPVKGQITIQITKIIVSTKLELRPRRR